METLKRASPASEYEPAICEVDLPQAVIDAKAIDWGVLVDAFLMNAVFVAGRYAASVFGDLSGAIANGSTVVTPPVRAVSTCGSYRLIQTLDRRDHYVVVSHFSNGEDDDD